MWYTGGIYLHPGKFCPIGNYCQSRSGSHTSIFDPQGLHYRDQRGTGKRPGSIACPDFQNGAEGLAGKGSGYQSHPLLHGSRLIQRALQCQPIQYQQAHQHSGLCSVGYPGVDKQSVCRQDKGTGSKITYSGRCTATKTCTKLP